MGMLYEYSPEEQAVIAPQPVVIRAVKRPLFNDLNLLDRDTWIEDNSTQLARYWQSLGVALGISAEDNQELDIWLKVQHEIQLAMNPTNAVDAPKCHGHNS